MIKRNIFLEKYKVTNLSKAFCFLRENDEILCSKLYLIVPQLRLQFLSYKFISTHPLILSLLKILNRKIGQLVGYHHNYRYQFTQQSESFRRIIINEKAILQKNCFEKFLQNSLENTCVDVSLWTPTSAGRSYELRFAQLSVRPSICNSGGSYMFKVNNRNTRTRCEIRTKLTIKTPERCPKLTIRHQNDAGVVLVSLLLTLGIVQCLPLPMYIFHTLFQCFYC